MRAVAKQLNNMVRVTFASPVKKGEAKKDARPHARTAERLVASKLSGHQMKSMRDAMSFSLINQYRPLRFTLAPCLSDVYVVADHPLTGDARPRFFES